MEATDLAERIARLQTVAMEMDRIIREVGPRLIRLAHLRAEARSIREEMDARPGS